MVPKDRYLIWLFETWEWLLYAFGGSALFRARSEIITPCYEHFPVDATLLGSDLIEDYFLFAKEHAGVSNWDMAEPSPALSQLSDPTSIVAALSLFIAKEIVSKIGEEHNEDAFEYLIDITAVFLGFGVFLCNRSSSRGASQPWLPEPTRLTRLSELELSYALAVYTTVGEIPDRDVVPHLTLNPRGYFLKAQRHLLRFQGPAYRRLRTVSNTDGPYRYLGIVDGR